MKNPSSPIKDFFDLFMPYVLFINRKTNRVACLNCGLAPLGMNLKDTVENFPINEYSMSIKKSVPLSFWKEIGEEIHVDENELIVFLYTDDTHPSKSIELNVKYHSKLVHLYSLTKK
jgi:hypothetical protein